MCFSDDRGCRRVLMVVGREDGSYAELALCVSN